MPLTPRELHDVRSWQRFRRWGLMRFMLFPGVFGWGAGMFAATSWWLPGMRGAVLQTEELISAAVLWALLGIVWAWFVYSAMERQVARLERGGGA